MNASQRSSSQLHCDATTGVLIPSYGCSKWDSTCQLSNDGGPLPSSICDDLRLFREKYCQSGVMSIAYIPERFATAIRISLDAET
jgi:hypothetical protein